MKGTHRVSRLTDLIRQAKAKDPALGADLEVEFNALAERRQLGLNFERHQPEAVELPGRPVRKGDKVRILPPRGSTSHGDQRLWRVIRVEAHEGTSVALLELPEQPPSESMAAPIEDLVVVAEFRDTIYPGLVSTGRLECDGTRPFHTVVNAENLHALRTLQYTHRSRIDAIYIDPPYNTGNDDWIYNDRHVSGDDLYRHSKWLAFMERRLLLARELLKDTGVIVVAIGGDEHHRLRMLMDQVFHESNFIADVMWEGVRKNDSRFVSASADYMLFYARNRARLESENLRWVEPKSGAEDVLAVGLNGYEESGGDVISAGRELARWWKSIPGDHPAKKNPGLKMYSHVDDVQPGRVYRTTPLISPNPRPNLRYAYRTKDGRLYEPPKNGWSVSQERMRDMETSGRLFFGPSTISKKAYLHELMDETVGPHFSLNRSTASKYLQLLLGDKRFPFPKDHTVLMRWLRMVAPKDAIILDFFGGSGSTMEAVMRLNSEDGGKRQCILVTNNEVGSKEEKRLRKAGLRKGDIEWEASGICEYVTQPRIKAVVTGKRPDGSRFEDTVKGNVEFFKLTYESPWRVARGRAFDAIAPLLWLRAGARGRRIDVIPSRGWDVADAYGVIGDLDATGPFLNEVAATESVQGVFVVTDDDRAFQSVCAALPDGVEPVRLYESYLRNFEIKGQE